MHAELSLAVATTSPTLLAKAEYLAKKLQLPLVEINDQNHSYLLVYTEQHLEIRQTTAQNHGPVYVDFLHGKLGYRRAHTYLRDEALAKAVGVKGGQSLSVIDATAGLGRDAFVLASLGCQLTLLERSPIIAALLEDGLLRLANSELSEKLKLIKMDAIEYLKNLPQKDYPDVIYLDPMFPNRHKTALVKKEMQLLQQIVGKDVDAVELLKLAKSKATKRVVVKRPRLAEPLGGIEASFQITSKHHRFDVYQTTLTLKGKGNLIRPLS